MYKLLLLAVVFFFSSMVFAQDEVIELNNPSFESAPFAGGEPANNIKGWQDCGVVFFEGETPPDIHLGMSKDSASNHSAFFGVKQQASDGFTFLGLVVRKNETYESVSQRMVKPMEANKCYTFSIDLSRSATYVSPYPDMGNSESYTKPVVLQIYGGAAYCDKRELLGESAPVRNGDWKTFEFEFNPTKAHRYFTLVAYFKTPVLVPYNGNLLVDNASSIRRILCPGEELAAEVELPVKKPKVSKPKTDPVVSTEKPVDKPPVFEKPKPVAPVMVINKELNRSTLKEGQTVKINNLYFEADASDIDPKSSPALEELAKFLLFNKDIKVEIGGHTNMQPEDNYADSLSNERAKSVAQFLLDNGIPINQLEYKGYGRRKPLTKAKGREAQARNQRVEIKVLQIGEANG